LFSPTRRGMRKLAAQMKAARPDTIVVATPHSLRLRRHICVVTSENSSGSVSRGGKEVRLSVRCDRELAGRVINEAEKRGIPVVGANYGTDSGTLSDVRMDWGTLIPLSFFLGSGPSRKNRRILIVSPARDIQLAHNFEFGRIVADVCEELKARVAFVASADQAHAHDKNGPYGYSSRAAEYDRLVLNAIRGERLRSIMELSPRLVEAAKPDSLWQMTMLAGLLDRVPMKGEIFSYQVPTYFGMACVGYPRSS
jgi:aromatic ring-opening dioxygenase LigB subunit